MKYDVRLAKMEVEMSNVKKSNDLMRKENKEEHTLLFKKHEELLAGFNKFINAADSKYATKAELKATEKELKDNEEEHTNAFRWNMSTIISVGTLVILVISTFAQIRGWI